MSSPPVLPLSSKRRTEKVSPAQDVPELGWLDIWALALTGSPGLPHTGWRPVRAGTGAEWAHVSPWVYILSTPGSAQRFSSH